MTTEVKVPTVGESITEVEIAEWKKQPGDAVEKDEVLVEVDTDKVSVEIPAPVSGTLQEIRAAQGATARIGEVIALIAEGATGTAGASRKAAPAKTRTTGASASSSAETEAEEPAPEAGMDPKKAAGPIAPTADAAPEADDADAEPETNRGHGGRIMPSARRLIVERGLNPEEIEATGPGGRLLKEDVLRHIEAMEEETSPHTGPPHAHIPPHGDREEEIVRMSPIRRRIAQRLVEAQQQAALLTTFNEIDMTAVMRLRREHQEAFVQKHRVKLGFMSFFVKASIEALKELPAVNAEVQGDQVTYKNYFDIGIAIGSGRGLVVPVLRNAESMSFAEIEKAIADYAERAQSRKLSVEELQGGTFTITNGGVYGSLLSTPIINPPQSGVLGMHAIQDRPVARNGEVVIRPMMYVALTYDHRIVDGREAVQFLVRIKDCIEEPSRMLLEI